MKLKHNLIVEYCYLMTRVCHERIFKTHPVIQHYRLDPEVEAVVAGVRDAMNPFLKKDLEYFVKNFTGSVSIPLMLTLEEGYQSVPEMIAAIEAMTPQAWLQYYFTLNDQEEDMDALSAQELQSLIQEQIQPQWDIPNTDDQIVLVLRAYAEESKEQIVDMYRRFYDKHFRALEAMLTEKLDALLAIHQSLLKEEPKVFMEEILWMKEEQYAHIKHVEFTVTWLGELTHSVSYDEDRINGIYGFGFLQRFDKDFIKKQTLKLFKVLSDERRLEILRMVGKKPCYATELAKALGLTKATVSYHMNLIIEQGLVTLRVDQNRAYYALNTERLGKQLGDVIGDLTGDESL